jgi:hypothetical protein
MNMFFRSLLWLMDVFRNKLVINPPQQFTQIYFECYNAPLDTLLSAVGIATGNIQFFLPFLVFATLPLFYLILVMIGQVPARDEYNNKEVSLNVLVVSFVVDLIFCCDFTER